MVDYIPDCEDARSMSAVSRDGHNSINFAAKRGVEGSATALRKELAKHGIKVGLIEPDFTGADFPVRWVCS